MTPLRQIVRLLFGLVLCAPLLHAPVLAQSAPISLVEAPAQAAPTPMPRPADRLPGAAEVAAQPAGDQPVAEGEEAPADSPIEATGEPDATADPANAQAALEAVTPVISDPQPVSLAARITEDGPFIPAGLQWRVFDTKTDDKGQLVMVAKSEEANPALSLPPGEYVVHVAYGRAQASDTLNVELGPNTKSLLLEAGGLRLNGAITGDIAVPAPMLRFDIYSSGAEQDRVPIAQNVRTGELVYLNAGTYHVVSYFGGTNATVRADLLVEPGKVTDAILYHRAAQVTFKLVSQAGGEAIADVEWLVKTEKGETIFSDLGAFPATVLAEGTYSVIAKRGDSTYNRDFEVTPGQPREVEVLTAVYNGQTGKP